MAIYSGFSHEKLWFSIVMLVYQRVYGCNQQNQFLSTRISHLPQKPSVCASCMQDARTSQNRWISSPTMADMSGNMVMLATPKSAMSLHEGAGLRNPPATLPPWFDPLETQAERWFSRQNCFARCYPYFYVRFARGHIDAEFTSLPQAKSRQLMVCMYAQDDKSSGKLSVVSGFGFTTVPRILWKTM